MKNRYRHSQSVQKLTSDDLNAFTGLLDYLKEIKWIGPFPHGILVLLVPLETAVQEVQFMFDKDMTANKLKNILLANSIQMFSNIAEYAKYKGL